MAGIKFTETEVPKVERAPRERKPNPYQEVADALVDHLRTDKNDGKALNFKPLDLRDGDTEKNQDTAIKRLRAAAGDRFTMRTKVEEDGTITAWGIPKVTRVRKSQGK